MLNSIPEGKEPKTRLATIAASMLEDGLSVHEQSEVEEAVSEAIVPNSEATGRNILEVNGGTVQYPKSYDLLGRAMTYLTAVDHVDLTILEGETLSIVGESGCGKTSLANAIVGLVPIADGTIKYKGIDINEQEASTRREIQIVFQDPQASLDPRWPVWRIMTEPLTVIQDYSRLELRRQAMELCEMVGLDPNQIDRLPHEFSGGQRQRIAIGRALSVRPRLLVLDEPTSALDVSVQAQILNLLLDLQKNYNLSYLFISHDVAVVRHISDRVAVMYMGEIVEFGDAQTILSAPQHDYTRTLMNAVPMLANAFPS